MGKIFLGVDYGDRRVGLAHGDELGFAFPAPPAIEPSAAERLAHIAAEARRRHATDIVVGYPLNMDGTAGARAAITDAFIADLRELLPGGATIHLADEGLSSVAAEETYSAKTKKQRARSSADHRRQRQSGDLDSRAAAVILQDFLNARGYGT
jgi:putative Holliday junction resolvase